MRETHTHKRWVFATRLGEGRGDATHGRGGEGGEGERGRREADFRPRVAANVPELLHLTTRMSGHVSLVQLPQAVEMCQH